MCLEDEDSAAQHPYVGNQRKSYGLADLLPQKIDCAPAVYWACAEYLDDCTGMLLWQLERAGALENIIIIYTSDHGEMLGHHRCWWKANYYEQSVRVPLIFSGPGIPQGIRRREPAALIELLPTLSALCGLGIPTGIDGCCKKKMYGEESI